MEVGDSSEPMSSISELLIKFFEEQRAEQQLEVTNQGGELSAEDLRRILTIVLDRQARYLDVLTRVSTNLSDIKLQIGLLEFDLLATTNERNIYFERLRKAGLLGKFEKYPGQRNRSGGNNFDKPDGFNEKPESGNG